MKYPFDWEECVVVYRPAVHILREPDARMRQAWKEGVKAAVVFENTQLLLQDRGGVSAQDLIPDPSFVFSVKLCEKLAAVGVLREDKQMFSWGDEGFEALERETLNEVAWELRNHVGFVNVFCVRSSNILAEETSEALSEESEDAEDDFFFSFAASAT
ncbi:hypothetical protein HC928_02240 [bacterium]|nr:hypothetical protein [bacterium]